MMKKNVIAIIMKDSKILLQLRDSKNWETIKEGMSFYVPKNSSFKVEIKKLVNYCCSYFDK